MVSIILVLTIILLCSGASIFYKANIVIAQPTVSLMPISDTDAVTIDKCIQVMRQMDVSYAKFDLARYQRQIRDEEGKLYYHKDARREFVMMFIKKPSGLWKLSRLGIITVDNTINSTDHQAVITAVTDAMRKIGVTKCYAVRPKIMDADVINSFHDGVKSYAWEQYAGSFKVKSTHDKFEVWELYR